jgi:hypothetical protein
VEFGWGGGGKKVFFLMLTKKVYLVCEIFGWQHLFFLQGAFYKKGCIRGTICLQMHPDPISDEMLYLASLLTGTFFQQ